MSAINRRLYQVMGYWIKEPSILNPRLAVNAVRELAQQGYDVIRVFVRHSNFNHRSPEVVCVVELMAKEARNCGVKISLDCEPHSFLVGSDMGNQFPRGMGSSLIRANTRVESGHFIFHVPVPQSCIPQPVFRGVESCFVRSGDKWQKLDGLEYGSNYEFEYYETGFSEMSYSHIPGRPILGKHFYNLKGRLRDVQSGELLVFLRFDDHRLIDFWSDSVKEYYDSLLEIYKHIPLDGFGWDEPFAELVWPAYRYGDSFAKAFERLKGYRLKDKFYLLEDSGDTPDAIKTRLDYYDTLSEGSFQAQKYFCEKVKSICGPEAILGTHHTWVGEGHINDYRSGAVDYFRLNQNMDAGYTDAPWMFENSVYYTHVLASSLGRLTPSGASECNTWHWKPTNANTDWHTRFMTFMKINWFNIWYGDASDTTKYPEHYTYPMCLKSMQRSKEFLKELVDARPVVDIAIWHSWEGAVGLNRATWAFAHKDFCLYASRTLVDRNIAFDFVDSGLLADAKVENKTLITDLESYKVLIMPYSLVMPQAVWAKCKEFATAGGKVIFIGPPASQTTEGTNIEKEFADLVGINVLPLDKFISYIQANYTIPSHDSFPIEVCYPLDIGDGTPVISAEGVVHGSMGSSGNVYYLTELAPKHELADLLEKLSPSGVVCYSDSILWRHYHTNGTNKIMAIAKANRTMKGIIRFQNHEIVFNSGIIALISFSQPEVKVYGDVDYQIV